MESARLETSGVIPSQGKLGRTCAHTMTPDFKTISGLAPKFSGFHRTRSASVPTATCPTRWLIPCVTALGVHTVSQRALERMATPVESVCVGVRSLTG